MISDQEFLHGAAFLRLVNSGQPITVTHVPYLHSSIYLVNSSSKLSGVLFKVSTKSRSAWSFTFSAQEDAAITALKLKYPGIRFFTAFICCKDGICCLSEEQLLTIFDNEALVFAGQRVSVARKPSGSYHVNGANKMHMEKSVPQNAWPKLII